MLGYVSMGGRGAADALLKQAADILRANGIPLAGAVQVNDDRDPSRKCHMDLHILSGTDVVRISQDLGALSQGCRLDPAGLESAVGLVAAALDTHPAILIVNKYGKQEIDGRGFRPIIAEALSRDIAVLVAVNPNNVPAFLDFAADLAAPVTPNLEAILDWSSQATDRQILQSVSQD